MNWVYKNLEISEIPAGYISFVYLITNLANGRKYVGKKKFLTYRTKTVKGKKKRIITESDWKDYYGSNDELKADVKNLGTDKFKREILYLCKNVGTANYLEIREQCDRRVLESDQYYNTWFSARVNKSHIKFD